MDSVHGVRDITSFFLCKYLRIKNITLELLSCNFNCKVLTMMFVKRCIDVKDFQLLVCCSEFPWRGKKY